jgi:hypothetical protein
MRKNSRFMMLAVAALLLGIAGPVLGQPTLKSIPCQSEGQCYCLTNRTTTQVEWWDGAFSKAVSPGNTECVSSNHSPNIKIWEKTGDDNYIGTVSVSNEKGCVVVFGPYNLLLRMGLTREQCSKLTCG